MKKEELKAIEIMNIFWHSAMGDQWDSFIRGRSIEIIKKVIMPLDKDKKEFWNKVIAVINK